MKRSWVLLLLTVTGASASEWDSQFEAGVEAYKRRDYAKAREAFEAILSEGGVSADLYYNLGNTAAKQKQPGYAIFYYRKALQQDPSHEDARFNLEFLQTQLVDQIHIPPDFVLFAVAKRFFYALTRVQLLLVTVSMWSLFWIAVAIHLDRPIPRWIRIVTGSLAVFLILTTLTRIGIESKQTVGIVLASSTDVKSEPLEKASTLFILHAGTEAAILALEDDWIEIRLADGKKGWIRRQALGIL